VVTGLLDGEMSWAPRCGRPLTAARTAVRRFTASSTAGNVSVIFLLLAAWVNTAHASMLPPSHAVKAPPLRPTLSVADLEQCGSARLAPNFPASSGGVVGIALTDDSLFVASALGGVAEYSHWGSLRTASTLQNFLPTGMPVLLLLPLSNWVRSPVS
jgi:hypothetical protein